MQPSEDRHDVGHGPPGIQPRCRVALLERDDPPARRCSKTGVFAMDGTTRQFKTHNTETRSLCYPWHPWYDHAVVIRDAMVKGNLAIFRGQLEPDERTKSLEIPQWMFDPVVCSAMHLQATPRVSIDALLDLKALFADTTVYTDSAVLQAEPQCLTPRGEANATHSATKRTTRAVSSTPTQTSLAEPSRDGTSRCGHPVDSTPVGTPPTNAAILPGGSGGKR